MGRTAAAGGVVSLRWSKTIRLTRSAAALTGMAMFGSGRDMFLRRTPTRGKSQFFREIGHLPHRSVLLADDETDLLLFPPLRSCWTLRGQPAYLPISGRIARRVILGALNLPTGHRLLLPPERQRAGDFQIFLCFVHEH
jgi:hypothetical protein